MPAVAPSGTPIRLTERIEDTRQVMRLDADSGIAHAVAEKLGSFFRPVALELDRHRTAFGEFQRIPHQIEEHLSDPSRISGDEGVHRPVNMTLERDALTACRFREKRQDVRGQLSRVEIEALDRELACFDLREVEGRR